jgi:hypothetical protein
VWQRPGYGTPPHTVKCPEIGGVPYPGLCGWRVWFTIGNEDWNGSFAAIAGIKVRSMNDKSGPVAVFSE